MINKVKEVITISKDNKRLLLYLGLLLLAVIITYKIPHDSYSIAQYIIRPIRINKGAYIYLSGLLPLLIILIGIIGILNLKRFAEKSKFWIIIMIVIIIMPIMKWTIDFTRTNYYSVIKDDLNAVDIAESDITWSGTNDQFTIVIKLKLIDYSRGVNKFKIRVYLPQTLSEYFDTKVLETKNNYITYGNRQAINVTERLIINNVSRNKDMDVTEWGYEDFKYEIFNEEEVVEIIDHGM